MRLKLLAIPGAVLAAGTAAAAPPEVATDIPPVHSLVARVMQGVGEPSLLVLPGGSPHTHAMRPSEARALAGADTVVWMGGRLTPWLDRAVGSLGSEAVSVELLEAPGTVLLSYREGAGFAAGHDAGGHSPSESPEEHRREHAHDEAEREHEHEHEEAGDAHEHAHGDIDPHAWLDPMNARAWLGTIAEALAAADPANAEAYRLNAAAGQAELDSLVEELSAELAAVRDVPFIVYHDGYRYFEERFGIEAAGAISLGDATSPSASRIAEIRDVVRQTGAVCVFAEPQFSEALVGTVTEGTEARAATLDPVGAAIEPGPELYPQLLRAIVEAMVGCLGRAA